MIAALLNSRPARWIGAALGAVLVFLGIIAHQRRDAAQDAEKEVLHEFERETSRRVEAGRVALRDAGDGSPDDRVRSSDAKWTK